MNLGDLDRFLELLPYTALAGAYRCRVGKVERILPKWLSAAAYMSSSGRNS